MGGSVPAQWFTRGGRLRVGMVADALSGRQRVIVLGVSVDGCRSESRRTWKKVAKSWRSWFLVENTKAAHPCKFFQLFSKLSPTFLQLFSNFSPSFSQLRKVGLELWRKYHFHFYGAKRSLGTCLGHIPSRTLLSSYDFCQTL